MIVVLSFPAKTYASMSERTCCKISSVSAYLFPWPGILPDHLMYPLKLLRDKIVVRLIINPVKKIEYYLIISNKGFAASTLLARKGNFALSGVTARRAEHFYTLLISDYKWATWRHTPIPEAFTKDIVAAGLAHQIILQELILLTGNDKQKAFEEVLEFSKRNYKEFVTFKQSKP